MSLNYTVVWRPGTGAQHWATGLSESAFVEADRGHFNNGLRLTILWLVEGSFTAVWRPGSGAQHWQTGMSFDELKRQDSTRFAQGMRLAWIDCVNDVDSDDGWYAVWRSGSGAQFWRTGRSGAEFRSDDAKFFAEGLRLVTMRYDSGGSEKYLGLWRPGTGAQHWWSPYAGDLATFQQKNAEREAAGERLVALPPYGLNAIWKSGTGASPMASAADLEHFKEKDTSLFSDGFRIASLFVGAWF